AARITGRHLISGRWLTPTAAFFESRSPAEQNNVIGTFPAGSQADADAAVAAARQAFPGWRRTSRIKRAELFDQLAQLIKRDTDELAALTARECGKVLNECKAEVVEGLHMVQYVFGTGRMPMGDVLASEIAEKDAYMRRKPWGVAAIITPWNFPFAVPLW